MTNFSPLMDLISTHESMGSFTIVYQGIPERYRPEAMFGRSLTEMTVGEVLAWQAYVTGPEVGAVSSAAGKWQVIRKTLAAFHEAAGLTEKDLFTPEAQDKIFFTLLRRRRLDDFLGFEISDFDFANALAREWAALPVVTDIQGANRALSRGETFYAGDGVNKALTSPEEILRAIRRIYETPNEMV